MARTLVVNYATSRQIVNKDDGIRVRIEVTEATEITDKVFAYLNLPLNPQTQDQRGYFDHVCSPTDIEEYPEDEPLADVRPEWFRLNFVDIFLRSREEAEHFIADVREDIDALLETLVTLGELEPPTIITHEAG